MILKRSSIFCLTIFLCFLFIQAGNTQIAERSKFYGFADVKSIDYSSDLGLVATGSELGTVVWDSWRERIKYTFEGNTKQVIFSPNSTQLAIVTEGKNWTGNKQNLILYNLHDGKVRQSWSGVEGSPSFSHETGQIAIAQNRTVTIVSLPEGKNSDSYKFPLKVSRIVFAPNDRDLAVATVDGTVYIYNLDRHQIAKTYPGTSTVTEIKFVPQYSWLLISRESEPIEGRSLLSDRIIPIPDRFNSQMSLADNFHFSNSGEVLSCIVSGNLEVYRLPTFKKLPITDYVWDIDISPDGKYVAIGAADYGSQQNGVKLVNLDRPQQTIDLNMGFDYVERVGFSQDGTKILAWGFQSQPSVSNHNYSIQIWDLPTLKPVSVLDGYLGTNFVATISPQKKLIAATDLYASHNNVFVWDLQTGERIARLQLSREFLLDDLKIHFSQNERQIAVETAFTDSKLAKIFVFSLSDSMLIGEHHKLPHNFSRADNIHQNHSMSNFSIEDLKLRY